MFSSLCVLSSFIFTEGYGVYLFIIFVILIVSTVFVTLYDGGCLLQQLCNILSSSISRFFDTSKQAIGAGVIHFANLFLADLFHGDPCTWYVLGLSR